MASASVMDAAGQAVRLAELRGRSWPGRTDLTDALGETGYLADDALTPVAPGEVEIKARVTVTAALK